MTALFEFGRQPLWVSPAVFAVAAAAVFFAGVRITAYADIIARETGVGQAATGLLLLGGVTSLPEVATSISAAASDNAALAVNNVLGGVAMQVAILAVADAAIGRDALTSIVAKPIVLLQGVFNVLLLALVAGAIVVGDLSILGIGAWTWGILAVYLYAIRLITKSEGKLAWRVDVRRVRPPDPPDNLAPVGRRREEGDAGLTRTIIKSVVAAGVIFVAGFLVARTGEAIAQATGLGSSFVGATLVGVSTSLPEVSTVLTAVRLGNYVMAVSDILGTNLFDVGLLFLIDAVHGGTPVLNQVGRFSTFAALLGIVLTSLFVGGLIERRDRTVLRMGYDSLAVLVAYLGGLVVLFWLR